jgi:hypothetical protein
MLENAPYGKLKTWPQKPRLTKLLALLKFGLFSLHFPGIFGTWQQFLSERLYLILKKRHNEGKGGKG